MGPTQAAEAAYSPEPTTGRATATQETAEPAPISPETAKSPSDTSDPASRATIEAEHDLGPGHGITSAANSDGAEKPKQPDTVLPPPQGIIAAVEPPRAAAITAQEQNFKNAEAESLLVRGDTFLATGDLASARLFYESAAAAGSGVAALRLGGTFDPAFLARVRIGRVQGDLASASYWYRRARDLGNDDAEILLKNMENTAR
jgi:hypothetical protein